MSQDEQDLIIGRATRELKQLKWEATAQRLEIERIGKILESLGGSLQLLSTHPLNEDQKAALDAPKLSALIEELANTWKRVEKLERELESSL